MRGLGYIDLPSGSAIFQMLIAGLLGISVAFRSFWRRVWHLLTGRGRKKDPSQSDPEGHIRSPGD
jgi:hypothetical protein